MRRWTRALVVSVALGCGRGTVETGPFPAGSPWASPERPRLEQEADTNDPQAYADLGEAYIARHPDTAAEKAIEINPNYAQPYLHLGRELEGVDRARAFASYDAFLLRSPRNDPSRAWVESRAMQLLADTLAPAKTP